MTLDTPWRVGDRALGPVGRSGKRVERERGNRRSNNSALPQCRCAPLLHHKPSLISSSRVRMAPTAAICRWFSRQVGLGADWCRRQPVSFPAASKLRVSSPVGGCPNSNIAGFSNEVFPRVFEMLEVERGVSRKSDTVIFRARSVAGSDSTYHPILAGSRFLFFSRCRFTYLLRVSLHSFSRLNPFPNRSENRDTTYFLP